MVKRFREAKKMTQAELAAKAKVTRPYVTMIENGRKEPSLAVLRRLAKALGVPVAELIK